MSTDLSDKTHRSLVGRLAGLSGIAYVALAFAGLGTPFFNDFSSPQILDWVKHNTGAIAFDGFLGGLSASLLALFVFLLVVGVGGKGLPAVIASSSMAAFLGIDWTHAGVYYALADAGRRGGADAGIVALFSLAKTITFADGFVFGMAVLAVSLLSLRSRSLPVPLVWLGFLVGVVYLVSTPIQIAINGSAGGVTGPIGVLLGLLWILAVAVVVLIKPVWDRSVTEIVSSPAPS